MNLLCKGQKKVVRRSAPAYPAHGKTHVPASLDPAALAPTLAICLCSFSGSFSFSYLSPTYFHVHSHYHSYIHAQALIHTHAHNHPVLAPTLATPTSPTSLTMTAKLYTSYFYTLTVI